MLRSWPDYFILFILLKSLLSFPQHNSLKYLLATFALGHFQWLGVSPLENKPVFLQRSPAGDVVFKERYCDFMDVHEWNGVFLDHGAYCR